MNKRSNDILSLKPIVYELGFVPIKQALSLESSLHELDNIFIINKEFPVFDSCENKLSVREILQKSIKNLLNLEENNILTKGFTNLCEEETELRSSPTELNTTLSLFRKKHWTSIFRLLGDRRSIFLLSNCHIIEKINDNFVLLAGDPFKLLKKKTLPKFAISPDYIYKRNFKLKRLRFEDILAFLQFKISDYYQFFIEDKINEEDKIIEINANLKEALKKIISNYNKLDIKAIFYSKFSINLKEKEFNAMKMRIPCSKIVDFLFLISKKIFKKNLSYFTFRILKSKIHLFFNKKQNDFMDKNELLNHFSFNDPIVIRFSYKEKRHIFENILLFIFKKIYFPVVFTFFYASKTSFSKHEIFYFTRTEWEYYKEISINSFLLDYKECKYGGKISSPYTSKLKVIPKKQGFRVITNNKISKKFKFIEVYLLEKFRSKLNNSTLSHFDFSNKIAEYMRKSDKKYFLKFDLKRCYDNLPHDKLIKFIDEVFKEEDNLFIQGYNILENKKGLINYQPIKRCYNKRLTLNEILKRKKLKKNSLIFEDFFFYNKEKDYVIKCIKNNIINNKIIYKNKVFKSLKGIPQGSVFSTLMCSAYMGYLDIKYFNSFIRQGIILRYVDDFLVMSNEKKEICSLLSFASKMNEHGIEINLEKLQCNFDIKHEFINTYNNNLLDNINLLTNDFVTWAGLKLFSNDFSVKCFFRMNDMKHSILVNKTLSLNYNVYKIFVQCEMRMYKIFFYKDNQKINENIYDVFYCFFIKLLHLFNAFNLCKGMNYNLNLLMKSTHKNKIDDKEATSFMSELIESFGNLNFYKLKSKYKNNKTNECSSIEISYLNALTDNFIYIMKHKIGNIGYNVSYNFLKRIAISARNACGFNKVSNYW